MLKRISLIIAVAALWAATVLPAADVAPVNAVKIKDSTEANTADVNGSGELRMTNKSIVSSGNSTSAALGSNATFTGTFEDILETSVVTVTLHPSHASASNGLVLQWSSDGVNVDSTDSFTIAANSGKTYSFGAITRYLRVNYTNGASAQSSFRMQTIYHRTNIKPSSHRLDDAVVDDDDAELSKSILTGKSSTDGVYHTVTTDGSGRLNVAASISGQKELTKAGQVFSYSTSVNAATASTDNPILLLTNPNGSGKNVFIVNVFCGVAVTNVFAVCKVFSSPTITSNGTTANETNRAIVASPATSVVNLFTLPTLSSNGTQLTSFVNAQNANSVSIIEGFQLMVEPNKSIAVTASPSSNNRAIELTIEYQEEAQ